MAVRHDVQVGRMSFPVEVPVLPPGWQHSEVDQVMARLQFNHAVVRRGLLHQKRPTGSFCLAKAALPLPSELLLFLQQDVTGVLRL